MTSQIPNLAPGSGLYLAALLDAASRLQGAGVGSKSQAAYDAAADLSALLVTYNGAPFAWAGRMTPDRPPYPHNPVNRTNPQVDDYVISQVERAQALDAAAPHVPDLGDLRGVVQADRWAPPAPPEVPAGSFAVKVERTYSARHVGYIVIEAGDLAEAEALALDAIADGLPDDYADTQDSEGYDSAGAWEVGE